MGLISQEWWYFKILRMTIRNKDHQMLTSLTRSKVKVVQLFLSSISMLQRTNTSEWLTQTSLSAKIHLLCIWIKPICGTQQPISSSSIKVKFMDKQWGWTNKNNRIQRKIHWRTALGQWNQCQSLKIKNPLKSRHVFTVLHQRRKLSLPLTTMTSNQLSTAKVQMLLILSLQNKPLNESLFS